MTLRYRVIVPYHKNGKVKAVSYPGTGRTYSRTEAIEALEKFHRHNPGLAPYAESIQDDNGERFFLEDVI